MTQTSFTPSPQQSDFETALLTTQDNLLIVADAGSGKTSTIVWGIRKLPTHASIVFLAFNKDIQKELESRLPLHVTAKTFHGLGYSAWRDHNPGRKFEVNGDKLSDILKKELDGKDFESYFAYCLRLTSLAKSAGLGSVLLDDSYQSWDSLITHHNLIIDPPGDEKRAIAICQKLLAASNKLGNSIIDYDDMLYLPLIHKSKFPRFNYVFIDEAQDTNSVQRHLLRSIVFPKPYGRLIAVGDPDQAIYGFRGAGSDSMSELKAAFSMTELPLSVSYRCSKSVVREAQKYSSK